MFHSVVVSRTDVSKLLLQEDFYKGSERESHKGITLECCWLHVLRIPISRVTISYYGVKTRH